ncbi:MAG: hypothetical protein LBC53_09550 [Spirochaetaceae bacterium]|jgi:hypothetical protein|nr:hypothetical protein [Spirochaetaceae bacterium]
MKTRFKISADGKLARDGLKNMAQALLYANMSGVCHNADKVLVEAYTPAAVKSQEAGNKKERKPRDGGPAAAPSAPPPSASQEAGKE